MARINKFDISKVDGVTPRIITEYKKHIRRERYLQEIDKQHIACHFSNDEMVYSLYKVANTNVSDTQPDTQLQSLYYALNMLKKHNELNYHIIIDYYFSIEKYSYSSLAKKYGVCKQTIYNRIHRSILYLRRIIIEFSKNQTTDD